MTRHRPPNSTPRPTKPDDAVDRLRLLRSRRVGPATWRRLMEEHANAEDAVRALPEMARAAGLADYAACPARTAERELREGARAGAVPLFLDDPLYPAALAALPDAPPLLWVRGDLAALSRPGVALVGARAASSLGLRLARRMAIDLGERGICVLSGLARGIDAAAHAGALEAGGRTVAVLAGGIDTVYPSEHEALAARIAAEGGALLSESPVGRSARAADFPRRNRIVSGLSRGVVVLEAALRSGSLSTARIAAEQGREVMAVPGHPLEARAAGPNALIRDGATLVTGAADVVEALGGAAVLGQAGSPILAPRTIAAPPGRAPIEAERARPADTLEDRGRRQVPSPSGGRPDGPATGESHDGIDPALGPQEVDGGVLATAASEGIPRCGRGGTTEPARRGDGSVQVTDRPGMALGPPPAGGRADPPHPMAPRGPEDLGILHDRIRGCLVTPRDEDDLIREMELPLSILAPAILALELDGRIERLPGARLVSR